MGDAILHDDGETDAKAPARSAPRDVGTRRARLFSGARTESMPKALANELSLVGSSREVSLLSLLVINYQHGL